MCLAVQAQSPSGPLLDIILLRNDVCVQIRYEEEMAKRPQPDLEHRPWQRAVKNLPATVEEPESGSSASQMQAWCTIGSLSAVQQPACQPCPALAAG